MRDLTERKLVKIKEAAKIVSEKFGKEITESNITYLVQYAKVRKEVVNRTTYVYLDDILKYYSEKRHIRKIWETKLNEEINWALSFEEIPERERTKHVHRLHPYKGKFIPQLVEYFLDQHINHFKKDIYFKPGDIVIDPFLGSGTTVVQALEMGIHSIGIEISHFNCMISKAKIAKYDLEETERWANKLLSETVKFSYERYERFERTIEASIDNFIAQFNKEYFPTLDYKRALQEKTLDEKEYVERVWGIFLKKFKEFVKKSNLNIEDFFPKVKKGNNFLDTWFTPRTKSELLFYVKLINSVPDEKIQNLLKILISRTARSCRATTHFDLATLKKPVFGPYYCYKHKKICRPVNSILRHLNRYTKDTIKRIKEFDSLRKEAFVEIIKGDSRNVNVLKVLQQTNPKFFELLREKKAAGIFTSPPYLGQIDYHEQHAYAYELLNLPREDRLEIGAKFKGVNERSKEEYVVSLSDVLLNMKSLLRKEANIFIVINDKYNLMPLIAERSGMKIVNEFKRPVLNRTERDKQPYFESIFHLKIKGG